MLCPLAPLPLATSAPSNRARPQAPCTCCTSSTGQRHRSPHTSTSLISSDSSTMRRCSTPRWPPTCARLPEPSSQAALAGRLQLLEASPQRHCQPGCLQQLLPVRACCSPRLCSLGPPRFVRRPPAFLAAPQLLPWQACQWQHSLAWQAPTHIACRGVKGGGHAARPFHRCALVF